MKDLVVLIEAVAAHPGATILLGVVFVVVEVVFFEGVQSIVKQLNEPANPGGVAKEKQS